MGIAPSPFTAYRLPSSNQACPEEQEAPAPISVVRLSDAVRAPARLPDEELVRLALAGEESAALTIVRQYEPLVRRYLAASLDARDLEDHVQEVFARCFEHLRRLRDPRALRSFLIGIALRLAGTERRRRRVRRHETLTWNGELPEPAAPPAMAEPPDALSRTRAILRQLKPRSSQLLELRFVQDKNLSEVAAALGISVATAKRQLARASARMRALARNEEAVVAYVRGSLPDRLAVGRLDPGLRRRPASRRPIVTRGAAASDASSAGPSSRGRAWPGASSEREPRTPQK